MPATDILSKTEETVIYTAQVRLEWKIKNFFGLPDRINYFLESPSFSIAGADWVILIYPNGRTIEQCNNWFGLHLRMKYSLVEVSLAYTLGIKKADGSVLHSVNGISLFKKAEEGYGVEKFFLKTKLADLKDIVAPDGTLTVFCTARLDDHSLQDAASQASSLDSVDTLSQNIKKLYVGGSPGDVTIMVKDKQFVAHKLILAARSSDFHSMFELDMVEKNSNAVNILDCDPDSFEDFLLFVYSGNLDIVSSKNAMGLYLTAHKYNLEELKVACSECMANEISVDSVCDVVHLATLHDEKELLNTAAEYFVNNASSILTTPKWLSFMVEHPTVANELLIKLANKSQK